VPSTFDIVDMFRTIREEDTVAHELDDHIDIWTFDENAKVNAFLHRRPGVRNALQRLLMLNPT
jgi:hypothetical protein